MNTLPAQDLRSNLGTWVVSQGLAPAVSRVLLEALPCEPYDPGFRGQLLETSYFDTPQFDLRKARLRKKRYLTLRLRCYNRDDQGQPEAYALSYKTEAVKQRVDLSPDEAESLLARPNLAAFTPFLSASAVARLLELVGDAPLARASCVTARRYAVEDNQDRLTLDLDVACDRGKRLPFAVLEFKSTTPDAVPPDQLVALRLPALKISKFLWSTEV